MNQPSLTTTAYLEAIARDSGAIVAAAHDAGLAAPVPTTEGWTVGELVVHLGNVQQWATTIVSTLTPDPISRRALSEEPGPAELLPWFEAQSAALVETLAAADPSTPVWSFTPDHTVRFWFRRQAHEAAVHRYDVELAAGRRIAVDTALAVDGVAEWLDISAALAADELAGRGETVHLHCTDTPEAGTEGGGAGEWLVTMAPDGPTIEAIHAKGDVAARGTASDLDLFVWGRVDADALEVFGDADLLGRFRAAGFS
jgi:uncharacterized protein (TIGR03083 family)